jgi:hypothetical protein
MSVPDGKGAFRMKSRLSFVVTFMSAALGTVAVFAAIYGVWVIVAPETPHPEVGIPALLLSLSSAAVAFFLWRRGQAR